MTQNISLQVANSVLDDYTSSIYPPPGLYKVSLSLPPPPPPPPSQQIITNYMQYESNIESNTHILEIKSKLEYELFVAKQQVIDIENKLNKVNDFIMAEQKIIQDQHIFQEQKVLQKQKVFQEQKVLQKQKVFQEQIFHKKPTDEFIQAIYELFSKESPIQLSNIPHKLPNHVLPEKGHSGLFSRWLDQVPGLKKETITHNSKLLYIYYLEADYVRKQLIFNKENVRTCWQKQRRKPCKLNKDGECKICDK